MALRLILLSDDQAEGDLIGKADGLDQEVRIERSVLRHLLSWQQHNSRAKEAGGQLFGLVASNCVDVKVATGPYRGDERERCHYRSAPRAAQLAIDKQAGRGLLYLGEWHTHAEDIPSASSSDHGAIRSLRAHSTLCTSALLMIIVGRLPPAAGVAMFSVDSSSRVVRWQIKLDPSFVSGH